MADPTLAYRLLMCELPAPASPPQNEQKVQESVHVEPLLAPTHSFLSQHHPHRTPKQTDPATHLPWGSGKVLTSLRSGLQSKNVTQPPLTYLT